MLSKLFTRTSLTILLMIAVAALAFSQATNEQIIAQISPSVVYILTGNGGGQLQSTGSGFIVKENGVLLTAYHLIKDAREVQVRLKSGEVYDQVELLGFDARRDVAALRIRAKGLPVLSLTDPDSKQIGEKVYVVSNPLNLTWSASDGILSAIRMADEVPEAGTGYKLIQFTAPISQGSSGAPVVDSQGRALGIVIASKGGQVTNLAIPSMSVAGLAEVAVGTPFGDGSALRKPVKVESPTSAAIAKIIPEEKLREAVTLRVYSSTDFYDSSQLEAALMSKQEFKDLKLLLIDGSPAGDLVVEISRPMFTFDFTYKITDNRTKVIVAAGKVGAWDSVTATPELANQIIKKLKAARIQPEPAKTQAAKK